MTCFNVTRQYRVIICAIVKNEVAFFRGINVLYRGVFRNADMKSPIQRVEVSGNKIFDHVMVINRFIKN